MAWSANKAQRDELYKIGVNSIVTFPNEGIVLFGDKTATTRPSSFDRINVRMAFIVAEKSIANFAKQFLFEVNDAFTQSQFLNAVRPFLRNMVSRRAFEDAKVIADDTNNTGYIKSTNQFVGTILLKPLYSINFINLNFVAVGPSVSFDEVVSQLS
jgi:phage tail sheath protein FI